VQSQGLTNGDGMSHSRLWFIRGYHNNFSQVFYCFHQVHDTGGSYTIVISNKDDRFFFFTEAFRFFTGFPAFFLGVGFVFFAIQYKTPCFFRLIQNSRAICFEILNKLVFCN
jgi:hypothetical protein